MRNIKSLGEKECILCTTKEECDIIISMMHDAGLRWSSWSSYKHYRPNCFLPNQCYDPSNWMYWDEETHKFLWYKIYPASQFIEQLIEKEQASEAKRHPKQGERVLVRDCDLNQWEEVIFLCEIPQAHTPYVCAPCYDESDYLDWKKVSVELRKQIKQLPTTSTYTLELTEEQYKKVQDLINW